MIHVALLLVSLLLAILAAVGVPSRVNLGWAALAFYVAAVLLGAVGVR